ncbi:MAG: hypothetical protein WC804_21580 [Sphingomonas sp.]|jgi:hypothetical protein|uniref:hypothetical protein n=1 Tax=Sphingomonas sp. TaxID=28214 RepID=UPI003562347F
MSLRVPSDLLPADASARHARLRDYFCDKDATATRVDGDWELDLAWPDSLERHVDLKIQQHLAPWEDIGLSGMATARRRSGRVLTSLYDTWTLLTWSEWAARTRPDRDTRITILHLDDHRDLMSPRLALEGDELSDMITGRRFDVRDPASVASACNSGAVGMGSFLTPFLLGFPRCDVRQLCQPPKITGTVDWSFVPTSQLDDLLRPGARRPAIALKPSQGVGPGQYRATNDLGDWLADIAEGPVLLHVDMDYFNNRYDGDGDWIDRMRRHDPGVEQVLTNIDDVTAALRSAGLVERIADAAVAFSPGFFPAELWLPAESRLRAGLRLLYE